MKSIRKLKSSAKAVAGTALLVGATLTGAGLAAADNHQNDLGDYPTPFVGEDGEVQSTIVVGESAATIDVVGAINVAGSLGQDAYSTESVSVGTGAGGTWSADNGVTLDTSNDNLYYGDNIDTVRQTLTNNDLGILEETTFTDDANEDTDVTNYLNVGTQQVKFGNGPEGIEDDEDPVLHVPVPAESDVDDADGSHLFHLQANFGESIDFSHEDVAGEEIELFGTSYQIAEDNTDNTDELLLYGSSESTTIDSGEESTVTIDGEEVTLGVTAVTSSDVAAVTVDGDLDEYDEDEEFSVNGQEVRVDNIIQTNNDQSAGTVVFSIGSQELVLEDGQPIQDSDDDDIEGSYVQFNDETTDTATIGDISSINLYVGAEDDEEDYVAAGDTFQHSALPGVEFQFGGLNPNAAEADSATEVSVETNGDEEAQISFTADSGDTVTQDFIHDTNEDGTLDSNDILADSDGDIIATSEGQVLEEDDYFTSDAGDFSHMWEITSEDYDSGTPKDSTLEIRDVATGNTVEIDGDYYVPDGESQTGLDTVIATEIIDGQEYIFRLNQKDGQTNSINVNWGEGAQYRNSTGDVDGNVRSGAYEYNGEQGAMSLFTAIDTENGGAIAFTDIANIYGYEQGNPNVYEFPSTDSTDSVRATVEVTGSGSSSDIVYGSDVSDVSSVDTGPSASLSSGTVEATIEAKVGDVVYELGFDADPTSDSSAKLVAVALDDNQNLDSAGTWDVEEDPAAVFMQPENEGDNENAFVLTPSGQDDDDGYQFNSVPSYTGSTLDTEALEGSDEDVDAGYNEYGTYVEADTEDEGSVSLMMPSGQSTAGAAFTGSDGSISAEGGGSGSVDVNTPTGFPDSAALDSDSNVEDLKESENLILVGGPAVNSLTAELADDNQTWSASDYTEGEGIVQVVNNAFTEGQDALVVAGYSGADTRAAANYIANYADNSDDLAGQSQVTVSTQ